MKQKHIFSKHWQEEETKMPNYIALIDLYTESDSINKAKELLFQMPQDNPEYACSIKYLYYQIYNAEKNYKEALLEE